MMGLLVPAPIGGVDRGVTMDDPSLSLLDLVGVIGGELGVAGAASEGSRLEKAGWCS